MAWFYKLTVYRKLLFGIFALHLLKLRFINRERTEIIWKTDPSEIVRTYKIRKQQTTATSFFLPHQNLAKSHHLSSGAKDSKPLKYINTDIREQNIYDND